MALIAARSEQEQGAFETLDHGFYLLRALPVAAWAIYFTGAVPFLLLLFWTATGIGILYSPEKALRNSFLCAVSFVWMQFWKVRFSEKLEQQLRAGEASPWPVQRVLRCVCLQSAVQAAKLVVLPAAAVAFLPWPWTVSFFRNITVLASRPDWSLTEVMREAARLASPHPKLTWQLFVLFFALGLCVFLNAGIFLAILPAIIKLLSGYENQFTRGTGNPLNWRLLENTLACTWLAMDALIQAVAVVRIYATESHKSGADLLSSLRSSVARLSVGAMLVVCAATIVRADIPPPVLEKNIDRVLAQEQYSWRNRAKADAPSQTGPLATLVRATRNAFRTLGNAIEVVLDWLRRIFQSDPSGPQETSAKRTPGPVKWTVTALAVVIALAMLIIFLRRLRPEPPLSAALTVPATINLEDESVGAADLPENGWLQLAQQSAERQEYRLALRALYLATLAHLGQKQLLILNNTKSNRDYQRELHRRSPNEQLRERFNESVLRFEAAWYGRHEAGPSQVADYRTNFEAVRADAS